MEDTISQSENGGERCYLAELYRIKGTLLAQLPDKNKEAKQCFKRALSIAKKQGAKWWELRIRISYLRLLQENGGSESEHQQLLTLYNQFTTGFDLPDLIEAKTVLDSY